MLEDFAGLRFGFIEAGASWVPFVLTMLAASGRLHHLQVEEPDFDSSVDLDLFRRLGLYVACQSQDDLGYLLRYGLEDNLLVGTDYTHADQSAELRVLDIIEERAERGVLSRETAKKILDDNPRRFFGL